MRQKRVRWALFGPISGIVLSIFGYAIVNFLTNSLSTSSGSSNPVQTIANVILYIVGAVSVIALPFGIVLGIIWLVNDRKRGSVGKDALSDADKLAGSKGWNWGAFFLSWVWGLGNNVYISLWGLVPVFGWFIWPFVLGIKGNQWAIEKTQWSSLEEFRATQKRWAIAGFIYTVIIIGLYAADVLLASH